ncbi:energy-coupled thiamine transporter ThiT [Pectinatus frisingensis]|uniref:energy-coupled thiamine transporter ThiT n=1 Tax=Pectinatus frisingensis TaxID=865 RepID=UPI0018C61D7D|nr:energy-coupled thiamine transporter ThiT [Pectinatus frisingensis]
MTEISGKLTVIAASPSSVFSLLGLLLLILAFLYIKKLKIDLKMLINIALMLALAFILHLLRLYHMPQGGSVTLGGMIPLLLIAFRYGPGGGYLAGFAYGMINLLQDPFILQPVQVLFDYPLPYMVLGLAGYFKNRIYLGVLIGITARFLCHFISGVAFFGSYAPAGMSPYWYSLIFNASYLLPELIICLLIIRVLPIRQLLHKM